MHLLARSGPLFGGVPFWLMSPVSETFGFNLRPQFSRRRWVEPVVSWGVQSWQCLMQYFTAVPKEVNLKQKNNQSIRSCTRGCTAKYEPGHENAFNELLQLQIYRFKMEYIDNYRMILTRIGASAWPWTRNRVPSLLALSR